MYKHRELEIYRVDDEDLFADLVYGVGLASINNSPFTYKQDEQSLRRLVLTDNNLFYNVYYENSLIGYMFIQYKTTHTVEFHWGVTSFIKYLPPIIKDSFEFCKELGIKSFLGTIPSDNKMSKKIASMMGFKTLTTINNYLDYGKHVDLVQYEV